MSALRNYGIDDGNGDQLTTGLQESTVRDVAQRMADERGEDVYVYSLDGTEDSRGEWQAAESWTVSPSTGQS